MTDGLVTESPNFPADSMTFRQNQLDMEIDITVIIYVHQNPVDEHLCNSTYWIKMK